MYMSASLSGVLALAAAAVPSVSASCPRASGNDFLRRMTMPHPEMLLTSRASQDGPDFGRCPQGRQAAGGGTTTKDFWPCMLNLAVLRQYSELSNPLGPDFDYATAFAKLDDVTAVQMTSQPWWPADYGNYGPFFVRMGWHAAGTYRVGDGRGGAGMGQQRFAPLNSWPDNANLDKARRLLEPVKLKYGESISWADLIVFAANNALENMGVPVVGFAFGRPDTWQADESTFWGSEHQFFGAFPQSNAIRYNGSTDFMGRVTQLEQPLADTSMGLIYVDPEGPDGNPNATLSARDIRETFGRMGMNDEETVALIAGGHAFGKAHGAANGSIGPEPNGVTDLTQMGFGWKNSNGAGNGPLTVTSGIEVIWDSQPTKWTNGFLHSLLGNNWTLVHAPGGGKQWEAQAANATFPDPFDPTKFRKPTVLTSDLGLRDDPVYKNISTTFRDNFDLLGQKFALAWYKLLHRDMGPQARYLGPLLPKNIPLQSFQDPLPTVNSTPITDADVATLKTAILAAGVNVSALVTTAWASASTFRISDKRGGANGARIALQPQIAWAANNPPRLTAVLDALKKVQKTFNDAGGGKQVSLADLIVLGGTAAVEKAASDAGQKVTVAFTPGRVDTTQDLTDATSFGYRKQCTSRVGSGTGVSIHSKPLTRQPSVEPKVDGFRNYGAGSSPRGLTEDLLVDKAALLTLSAPEMTVLLGGMRALGATYDGSSLGVLTTRPGQLTQDWFINLLSMNTTWSTVSGTNNERFEGKDSTGKVIWTASRADLIFGNHPELRALVEVYASAPNTEKFTKDFAAAWTKVMELDRYDIKGRKQNNVQ